MGEKKKFLSYVVPAVLAFALSGIYCIVDGFFVGNCVGDDGLTAINLVYPIVAVLQASGTGIGIGGAVMYSISRAADNRRGAEKYLQLTFILLMAASVLLTAGFLVLMNPILNLLGAEGTVAELGRKYLTIVVAGAIFQVFGTGIVPLIRNQGGASYSMCIMIAGFTGNTVLNYFLIWILKTGVSGAATSTLIGQSITAVGGLLYLWKKKIPVLGICLDTRRMIRIMKVGVSSFGITLCPNISLFLMNRFLMSYGGNAMVACYAVISYGTMIVYLLLQGVGDGCQPLLSDCYGRREEKQLHFLQRMAYITAEGIAVFCLLSLYLTRGYLGMLFGASKEVCSLVETNMPIILIGFLFLAVARVATAGFYATEQSGKAILLVYSEVIFLFLFLLIFPRFFGTVAVWVSMLGAQIMACICAIILLKIQ